MSRPARGPRPARRSASPPSATTARASSSRTCASTSTRTTRPSPSTCSSSSTRARRRRRPRSSRPPRAGAWPSRHWPRSRARRRRRAATRTRVAARLPAYAASGGSATCRRRSAITPPSPANATTSAPPAPMPPSSHWNPSLADGADAATWCRTCGFAGQVGACCGTGFVAGGIGFCWSGAATSVPLVTLPDGLEPDTLEPGMPASGAAGMASAVPERASVRAPAAAPDFSARERDRTGMEPPSLPSDRGQSVTQSTVGAGRASMSALRHTGTVYFCTLAGAAGVRDREHAGQRAEPLGREPRPLHVALDRREHAARPVAVGGLEAQRGDRALPRAAERDDAVEDERHVGDGELEMVGVAHGGPPVDRVPHGRSWSTRHRRPVGTVGLRSFREGAGSGGNGDGGRVAERAEGARREPVSETIRHDAASLPTAVARRAAPVLGPRVPHGLREGPAMPGRVLGRVLALAVLEVRRLHEDPGAVRARALAVGARVLDAHDDRVRLLARPRRAALAAHVAHDERAVPEGELRAVVLADLHALGEAERGLEERDRRAHVGIDEHGDDRYGGDRVVALHPRDSTDRGNAASTTSGVTAAIPSTTTAASARASAAGGNARIGTATTAIPAAAAERSPLAESSTATQAAASTPSRRAASR